MAKRTYSSEFKICIIKELLKQVLERIKEYEKNPQIFTYDIFTWYQSQRCALITVLDILGDDLSYMAKETLDEAHNMMETLELRNKEDEA